MFGPKAKDNEEIRGLLNAGHRRGAVAGRCVVKGKTVVTEEIPAYCAVALAGLGGLPDTLLSRSVVVRMRRRAPGERVEPFRRRVQQPKGTRSATSWRAGPTRSPPDVAAVPDMPDGIADRDADVWEALLAVADAAGGDWPERARVAAVALVADSKAEHAQPRHSAAGRPARRLRRRRRDVHRARSCALHAGRSAVGASCAGSR